MIGCVFPDRDVVVRVIAVGAVAFGDKGVHKVIDVYLIGQFPVSDIDSVIECVESVVVAGDIVFVGAFAEAIDTHIHSVDIDDGGVVSLPVEVFEVNAVESPEVEKYSKLAGRRQSYS